MAMVSCCALFAGLHCLLLVNLVVLCLARPPPPCPDPPASPLPSPAPLGMSPTLAAALPLADRPQVPGD